MGYGQMNSMSLEIGGGLLRFKYSANWEKDVQTSCFFIIQVEHRGRHVSGLNGLENGHPEESLAQFRVSFHGNLQKLPKNLLNIAMVLGYPNFPGFAGPTRLGQAAR